MRLQLIAHLRSGLIALGVLAGLTAPALAGPAVFASAPPVTSDSSAAVTEIQYRCRDQRCWDGDRRDVRRGDWSRWDDYGPRRHVRRHWDNDDWRWRRHHRHYRPYRDSGVGIYLDLGGPRYVAPRYVEPRRVYRGATSAHVRWCYDRWRSYRAWDNSYQPYHGRRRQCVSPYI